MIKVQREDFDVSKELDRLTVGNRDTGGIATFLGVVRASEKSSNDRITAMTLEHYPGMTERQLAEIESEAHKRWPLEETTIIHRYGRLEPGERIVFVACASAHRHAAFEACAFLVDWLKTRAPFWKLEETESGERWVEARADDGRAAARWREGTTEAAE